MEGNQMTVSVIVPFYKGNQYLNRLLTSINNVEQFVRKTLHVQFEIIIVNDSPYTEVVLPDIGQCNLAINIQTNEVNMGIHCSRVSGLKKAIGDWVIFLDQDDELLKDGFIRQLKLAQKADVVVGNGLYQYGEKDMPIYKNQYVMDYLIQKKRFIEIRNLIPSPGECLIRKDAIPQSWIDSHLRNNGADDWLLWILLFEDGKKFLCNDEQVYRHNDAGGNNLSFDLDKMKASSNEMYGLLEKNNYINGSDLRMLRRAIDFKYLQDTKKLNVSLILKYMDTVLHNVAYRLHINFS